VGDGSERSYDRRSGLVEGAWSGNGVRGGLYQLLLRAAPERMLTPIAVDLARAWILLPDGGPALGDRLAGANLAAALAAVLRRYGELQRAFSFGARRPWRSVPPTCARSSCRRGSRRRSRRSGAGSHAEATAATKTCSVRSPAYATATDPGASAWPPYRGTRASITTTCTRGTCSSQSRAAR
jgi:hypothetical protein